MGRHMNCPLCLDGYSSPRKLPGCKHSFCTTCIYSYVECNFDKEHPDKWISCPICSSRFPVSRDNDSVIEWVKSLPLNYHLMVILQQKNEKKIFPCEPCDTRRKTLQDIDSSDSWDTDSESRDTKRAPSADYFCSACEEAYCTTCSLVHKSSRATLSHELVETSRSDIDEVILRSGTRQFCSRHSGKEIEYFCNDHKEFLCTECALARHKSCRSVEDSKEFSRKLNFEKFTEEIEVSSRQTKIHFDNILKVLQVQTEGVGSKMEGFKSDVAHLRHILNCKIDEFEKVHLEAFESVLKQSEKTMNESEKTVKGLESAFHTEHILIQRVIERSPGPEASIVCLAKHQQLKTDVANIGAKLEGETSKVSYQFSPVIIETLKPGFSLGTFNATKEKLKLESILPSVYYVPSEVGSEESEESQTKVDTHATLPEYGNGSAVDRSSLQHRDRGIEPSIPIIQNERQAVSTVNENKGRSKQRRKKRVFSIVDLTALK